MLHVRSDQIQNAKIIADPECYFLDAKSAFLYLQLCFQQNLIIDHCCQCVILINNKCKLYLNVTSCHLSDHQNRESFQNATYVRNVLDIYKMQIGFSCKIELYSFSLSTSITSASITSAFEFIQSFNFYHVSLWKYFSGVNYIFM